MEKFIDNILIYDTEYTKVRIGDKHDGGYVVLDEISANTELLYSYGVETNSSFEKEFVEKYNCEALLFDHTVNEPAMVHPQFTFVQQGLWVETTEDMDTLPNHIERYGNPYHKTLKMDIEWCEWDVFEDMSEHLLDEFDQILCEFHMIPVKYKDSHSPYFTTFHKNFYDNVNEILLEKYKNVLLKLQKQFYIFHVHCNNSIPVNYLEGGNMIPPLVEMSLVNKRCIRKPRFATGDFPVVGLDYPNKTDRPDITSIPWNR